MYESRLFYFWPGEIKAVFATQKKKKKLGKLNLSIYVKETNVVYQYSKGGRQSVVGPMEEVKNNRNKTKDGSLQKKLIINSVNDFDFSRLM